MVNDEHDRADAFPFNAGAFEFYCGFSSLFFSSLHDGYDFDLAVQ